MPTTDAKTPHTVTLSALAAYLALNALEQPGWTKSNRELFAAFELLGLFDTDPALKAVPAKIKTAQTQRFALEEAPEWCALTVTLKLTDGQRDGLRKCLTALRDGLRMPAGAATVELIKTFVLE